MVKLVSENKFKKSELELFTQRYESIRKAYGPGNNIKGLYNPMARGENRWGLELELFKRQWNNIRELFGAKPSKIKESVNVIRIFIKGEDKSYTVTPKEGTVWVNHLGDLVVCVDEGGNGCKSLVWKDVDIDKSMRLDEDSLKK